MGDQPEISSMWWYGTLISVIALFVYPQLGPSGPSLVFFYLGLVPPVAIAFCVLKDVQEIREAGISWSPSDAYVLAGLFVPIIILYGYRRYRHVGVL